MQQKFCYGINWICSCCFTCDQFSCSYDYPYSICTVIFMLLYTLFVGISIIIKSILSCFPCCSKYREYNVVEGCEYILLFILLFIIAILSIPFDIITCDRYSLFQDPANPSVDCYDRLKDDLKCIKDKTLECVDGILECITCHYYLRSSKKLERIMKTPQFKSENIIKIEILDEKNESIIYGPDPPYSEDNNNNNSKDDNKDNNNNKDDNTPKEEDLNISKKEENLPV